MIGSGNATASSAVAGRTATSVTNSGVPNGAPRRRPSAMSGRRSVSGGGLVRSAGVAVSP